MVQLLALIVKIAGINTCKFLVVSILFRIFAEQYDNSLQ